MIGNFCSKLFGENKVAVVKTFYQLPMFRTFKKTANFLIDGYFLIYKDCPTEFLREKFIDSFYKDQENYIIDLVARVVVTNAVMCEDEIHFNCNEQIIAVSENFIIKENAKLERTEFIKNDRHYVSINNINNPERYDFWTQMNPDK